MFGRRTGFLNGFMTGGFIALVLALLLLPDAGPFKRRVLKRMLMKRGRDLGLLAGKMVFQGTRSAMNGARRVIARSLKH
ncbi:MAG TPA: hypothetical protein GX507_02365 [Clostridia bacterium]|nr:hypothetical protein [Clostridia bacterium]